jgi:hypothetical protein
MSGILTWEGGKAHCAIVLVADMKKIRNLSLGQLIPTVYFSATALTFAWYKLSIIGKPTGSEDYSGFAPALLLVLQTMTIFPILIFSIIGLLFNKTRKASIFWVIGCFCYMTLYTSLHPSGISVALSELTLGGAMLLAILISPFMQR